MPKKIFASNELVEAIPKFKKKKKKIEWEPQLNRFDMEPGGVLRGACFANKLIYPSFI